MEALHDFPSAGVGSSLMGHIVIVLHKSVKIENHIKSDLISLHECVLLLNSLFLLKINDGLEPESDQLFSKNSPSRRLVNCKVFVMLHCTQPFFFKFPSS